MGGKKAATEEKVPEEGGEGASPRAEQKTSAQEKEEVKATPRPNEDHLKAERSNEDTPALGDLRFGPEGERVTVDACHALLNAVEAQKNATEPHVDRHRRAAAEKLQALCADVLGIGEPVPTRVGAAVRECKNGGDAVMAHAGALCGREGFEEGLPSDAGAASAAAVAASLAACAHHEREHEWAAAAMGAALALLAHEAGCRGESGCARAVSELTAWEEWGERPRPGGRTAAEWSSRRAFHLNKARLHRKAAAAAAAASEALPDGETLPEALVQEAYALMKLGDIEQAGLRLRECQENDMNDDTNASRRSARDVRRAVGVVRRALSSHAPQADVMEDLQADPRMLWVVARDLANAAPALRDQRWRRGAEAVGEQVQHVAAALAAVDVCEGRGVRVFFDHSAHVDGRRDAVALPPRDPAAGPAEDGVTLTAASAEEQSAEAALLSALEQWAATAGADGLPALVADCPRLRRQATCVVVAAAEARGDVLDGDDGYPAPVLTAASLLDRLAASRGEPVLALLSHPGGPQPATPAPVGFGGSPRQHILSM